MGMCGVCPSVCGCARVCGGVHECAGVCMSVCMGVLGCVQVWEGVHGYARVCTGVRGYAWVWDVFSEFLLENRVPTSADFNTFPIRIFLLHTVTIYFVVLPISNVLASWRNGIASDFDMSGTLPLP